MTGQREKLRRAERWVIKIGSALLTNDGLGLDREAIDRWVDQIVQLRHAGVEIVIVSSGSIAAGMQSLGWSERPKEVYRQQAAAAVGQMGLVQTYESSFERHGLMTAQVLLTHDDMSNRKRYLNARSTLRTLIDLNVVAIINENDTVATSELRFGDNDTLGALVANSVEADALILLTDQSGLYEADPRKVPDAPFVSEAQAGDPRLDAMAGDGGKLGRGGMSTKVRAAKLAARSGALTVIASGREPDVLVRLHQGESLGTLLWPAQEPMAARKQWIAGQLQVCGTLKVDAGAVRALRDHGKSLLPAGVTAVQGEFTRGEVVQITGPDDQIIARGLVNYSSQEAAQILGHDSHTIADVLGFVMEAELVHRDNLVVI